MDTRKFWRDLSEEQQQQLAEGAELSVKYLYLIFYGHKIPSADKAAEIERSATNMGLHVPRETFRPETFA